MIEKFRQNSNEERNIKKDKLKFIESINASVIDKINIEYNEKSLSSLILELNNTKLFLLGEVHGIKENCNLIYTLFKKFNFKNLALEWTIELSHIAENFLQNGKVDFEKIKDSADGRVTSEHLALLKKLKQENLLEKLICFDETLTNNWNDRDASMAKNIVNGIYNSSKLTLVIAGNLHTELKPIILNKKENVQHPMGENLKKEIPHFPSGEIKYLTGKFQNFGIKTFREKPKDVLLPSAKFYKIEDDKYIFELPEAHSAIVPNPSLRIN